MNGNYSRFYFLPQKYIYIFLELLKLMIVKEITDLPQIIVFVYDVRREWNVIRLIRLRKKKKNTWKKKVYFTCWVCHSWTQDNPLHKENIADLRAGKERTTGTLKRAGNWTETLCGWEEGWATHAHNNADLRVLKVNHIINGHLHYCDRGG